MLSCTVCLFEVLFLLFESNDVRGTLDIILPRTPQILLAALDTGVVMKCMGNYGGFLNMSFVLTLDYYSRECTFKILAVTTTNELFRKGTIDWSWPHAHGVACLHDSTVI